MATKGKPRFACGGGGVLVIFIESLFSVLQNTMYVYTILFLVAEKPAPPLMPAPELIPGCPPGLEYLTQIDQLLVHQQIELLESKLQ